MTWEPEPIAITDLGNERLRIRVQASPRDGVEFSAVLGLPVKVSGHLYRVSLVSAVPGSGRANVPELLDLTLRLVDDD